MKKLIFIFIMFSCFTLKAEEKNDSLDLIIKQTNENIIEGKKLLRLEKSSWVGTDILLAKKQGLNGIGGYFSYSEKQDEVNCVFYSNEQPPQIVFQVIFDSTFSEDRAQIISAKRDFSPLENKYLDLRNRTKKLIATDTLFTFGKGFNPNIVPMIDNGIKKVYILTGSLDDNLIVLGNDYLLKFDPFNVIIEKKRIHQNEIIMDMAKMKSMKIQSTVHIHNEITGDVITPTDVCTLALYDKYLRTSQHIIMGPHFTTFFDSKKMNFSIVTKETMEKMSK